MNERSFTNATGIQRRSIGELRTGTGDEFALVDYATLYNNLSHNLGGFRETIRPGAFNRSLKDPRLDCKMLFNHNADKILGRTTSGTLKLSQDDRGLKFRCQLDPNNTDHANLYAAVKRGDISECSFAFVVKPGGQSWSDGTDPDTGEACAMRTLTDVDLLDCSVVTYPAYPNTQADARNRSVLDTLKKQGLVEAMRILRKASQFSAHDLIKQYRADEAPYDYATVAEHLRIAGEFCEAATAISHMADDCVAATESAGARKKNISAHDTFRGAQRTFHAASKVAAEQCAVARLYLARCMEKKSY